MVAGTTATPAPDAVTRVGTSTGEPGVVLVDRQRLALAVDALWRYEAVLARVAAGPPHLRPLLRHFGAGLVPPVAQTDDERALSARLARAVEDLVEVLAVVRSGPVPEAPPSPVTRRRWRARWLEQIADLDGAVVTTATTAED